MISITWYGHACFRLDAAGRSVVTDPYTPWAAGLRPLTAPADLVVMSSAGDEAHSCAAMVPGAPAVVDALRVVDAPVHVAGVPLEAVATSEAADHPGGARTNAMYRVELGGVAVCHMGDVGTPLSAEQLAPLRGRVDVLLALAGGGLTIALPDLDAAIDAIGPRVVVPMHYATPSLRYACGPLGDFLARRRDRVVRHAGSVLQVSPDRLPEALEIHVLTPAGDPAVVAAPEASEWAIVDC